MRNIVRQGGSVAVFVIVGIILVLIALGVLYGLKQVALKDGTPPMDLPGILGGNGNESGEPNKDQVRDNDSNNNSNDQENGSNQGNDATTDGSADSPNSNNRGDDTVTAPGDDSSAGSGGQAGDSSSGTGSGSTGNGPWGTGSREGSASDLPQSGPAETAAAAVALVAITTSATAYVRSLRQG